LKKLHLFWFLALVPWVPLASQQNLPTYKLTAFGGYISPDKMPFWLRSNQFGSLPIDNASLSLIGSATKNYDTTKTKIFDWGTSFEGRLNVGNQTNLTLIEGYAKMRVGIFEVKAGRSKEFMGFCDSTLSSGSYSVSGTALGIPKVQISIPQYYTLPLLWRVLAFKGQYAHGWLGEKMVSFTDTMHLQTWFHQKSLYGRFGRSDWRLKLYGGFNHQVFWGNERKYEGEDFTLSPFESFIYVNLGKAYGNGSIVSSKVGDHLGSIDLAIEYRFNIFKVMIYRQNIYEAGALYYMANIEDGLNGISFENPNKTKHFFNWKKFLFEFLYTKNQAGESWSPYTPSPYENYYSHYIYRNGWTYNDIGLGTPFITTRAYVRDSLPNAWHENFINNRVKVFHFGFQGSIQNWDYTIKCSWSKNYGTYYTTDEEQTTDIPNPGKDGVFGEQKQFSAYLACYRAIGKGFNLGCTTAFDVGDLYYNSFGILFSVSKEF
jgi:hypothetical protein